ncbi:MAG: putative Phosphotransferase [Bacteriovoracaceae bacterium]|nr:putative Phosphotransferase [Bacteriovoracaceae bacterium]
MSVPVQKNTTKDEILQRVQKVFTSEKSLSEFGAFEKIDWLPGDASNRFYGRVHLEKKTLMLMVMNAPEAFKSEEITGALNSKVKELPFVSIGRILEKENVRVPHIYYVASDAEFLLSEDLGDELLYLRRQKEGATGWYERALDELAKVQKIDRAITPHRFTLELLTWEAEHFVEYAILKRGKKVSDSALKEIRACCARLVEKMVNADYVLVHRDFHSKNLLILDDEKKIGVIDFQDALMGPPTYDLASLLRDSYVRLEDHEEENLIRYFETISKQKVDRELYFMTSLQRNLKAVGRFYYILMVKGRDTHIPFVRPSLQRIFKTLKQLKELKTLALLEGLFREEAG